MAKQPRVWTGTQWDTLAVTLPDLSNYSTTTQMNTAIDDAKGLVYIAGSTFSAASTIDITNCFSSTYQNYEVVMQLTTTSTNGAVLVYMLNGSTPATASSGAYTYKGWTNANAANDAMGSSQAFCYFGLDYASGLGAYMEGKIFNPYDSVYTKWSTRTQWNAIVRFGGGYYAQNTSYDGIRFSTTAGNITGTVRIYGYKDS